MISTARFRWFALVRASIILVATICALNHFSSRSSAGLFSLVDGNSQVDFDTSSASNAYSWTVDGQGQLFQQAFWYRVGNTAETTVHTLPIHAEGATDTNLDGDLDTLFVRYNGAGFDIEVRYSLDGGLPGSGASDMGEQISIINYTQSPLDFHFFQYVDFDLLGTSGDDRAVFTNANAVRQFEGTLRLTETVVTPVPSHREIGSWPTIIDKLEDLVASTLSDTPGTGVVLGPGDMTWAYQWDVVIPANGTFQISKDKNLSAGVIPEPATVTMFVTALTLLGLRRSRQRLLS